MAIGTGRWGRQGAHGSEPGGRWLWEMAPTGNNTKSVSVCVTQCKFLPLSVISLNCVVYIVNVNIAHFLPLSYSAWCVCVAWMYFLYCKRLCKFNPLFLKKLYPI